VTLLAGRHDTLLHRCEQRGLEARGRAVELVEDDGVGEDRTELECLVTEAVGGDQTSDDVLRRKIAGALDTCIVTADRACDDAREGRLTDAGDVLDQQVAVGEQRTDCKRTTPSTARAWSRARISASAWSSSSGILGISVDRAREISPSEGVRASRRLQQLEPA
jgi:hypothetical protein